jgi:hypothetical protein
MSSSSEIELCSKFESLAKPVYIFQDFSKKHSILAMNHSEKMNASKLVEKLNALQNKANDVGLWVGASSGHYLKKKPTAIYTEAFEAFLNNRLARKEPIVFYDEIATARIPALPVSLWK